MAAKHVLGESPTVQELAVAITELQTFAQREVLGGSVGATFDR